MLLWKAGSQGPPLKFGSMPMSYSPQIMGDPGEQAFPYTKANFRWGPEFKF